MIFPLLDANFACITSLLTAELQRLELKKLKQRNYREVSFQFTLQKTFISPVKLSLLGENGLYNLERHTGDRQIRGVLLQKQNRDLDRHVRYKTYIVEICKRDLAGSHQESIAAAFAFLLIGASLKGTQFMIQVSYRTLNDSHNLTDNTDDFVR